MNYSVTEVLVEQPLALPGSAKKCNIVYFMTESTISNHWGVAAP